MKYVEKKHPIESRLSVHGESNVIGRKNFSFGLFCIYHFKYEKLILHNLAVFQGLKSMPQ